MNFLLDFSTRRGGCGRNIIHVHDDRCDVDVDVMYFVTDGIHTRDTLKRRARAVHAVYWHVNFVAS